jgi:hypothetical protein
VAHRNTSSDENGHEHEAETLTARLEAFPGDFLEDLLPDFL